MAIPFPPGQEHEENQTLQRLRNGVTVQHCETLQRRKDGRAIDVSVTISPIHEPSEELLIHRKSE
jgi:hypothetical protein